MEEKDVIYPIRRDYLSGMSFAAIGRKYYIDQRTAKRYALQNLPMAAYEKRVFPSSLDPFKPKIDEWLRKEPMFASVIRDHLVEMGCICGYTIVNDYVRSKIQEYEDAGIYRGAKAAARKERFSSPEKAELEKAERGERDVKY
jgi:hypothetical protein